jgi:hypothetical protein
MVLDLVMMLGASGDPSLQGPMGALVSTSAAFRHVNWACLSHGCPLQSAQVIETAERRREVLISEAQAALATHLTSLQARSQAVKSLVARVEIMKAAPVEAGQALAWLEGGHDASDVIKQVSSPVPSPHHHHK